MKKLNKQSTDILDTLINIIERPDSYSDVSKELMVATIKIITGRMTAEDNKIFTAQVSQSEYNKYLKCIFDEYKYGFLNDKIKQEYEGVDNEIS